MNDNESSEAWRTAAVCGMLSEINSYISALLSQLSLHLWNNFGTYTEVRPQKSSSDFNEIWYVDRIGQDHECLKATQEESTISHAQD